MSTASSSGAKLWRWTTPLRPSWERELGRSALELVPDWYRDMTPNGRNAFRPFTSPVTDDTTMPHLGQQEYRVARFAWELRAAMAAPKATDRELWARRVRLLDALHELAGACPKPVTSTTPGPVPGVTPGPFEAGNSYVARSRFAYLASGGGDCGAELKGTGLVTAGLPASCEAVATAPEYQLLAPGKVRATPEPSSPLELAKWARAKAGLDRRHRELEALSAWYRVAPQTWAFNPLLPTARDPEPVVPVSVRGNRSLVQEKAPFQPKSWLDYGLQVLAYLRELAASGQVLGQDASRVGRELESWVIRGVEDFACSQAVRSADHFLVRECNRLDRWAHVWHQRVVAAKSSELGKLRKVPAKKNLVCDRRKCYKYAAYYVNNRPLCRQHAQELAGKGARA